MAVASALYALVMYPRFQVRFENDQPSHSVAPGLGTVSIQVRNKTLRALSVTQAFCYLPKEFALVKVGVGGREIQGDLTVKIPAGPNAGMTYLPLGGVGPVFQGPIYFGRNDVLQVDLTFVFPPDPGDHPLVVSLWPSLTTERKYSLKVVVRALP